MKINTKSRHVTRADGNVFADLGFKPAGAAKLQTRSKRIIADKLTIKQSLMAEISDWIDESDLRQVSAAKVLGVSRPRVSDVVRGQTGKFTIDALVDMLSRAGKRVRIKVT